jgi:hypothetical protein
MVEEGYIYRRMNAEEVVNGDYNFLSVVHKKTMLIFKVSL